MLLSVGGVWLEMLSDLVDSVVGLVVLVYMVSAFIYIARVIRGPTLYDRVLAIDALSYDLTVFMALLAYYTRQFYVATPIIIVALWGFALDLYVSKIIEKREIGA